MRRISPQAAMAIRVLAPTRRRRPVRRPAPDVPAVAETWIDRAIAADSQAVRQRCSHAMKRHLHFFQALKGFERFKDRAFILRA